MRRQLLQQQMNHMEGMMYLGVLRVQGLLQMGLVYGYLTKILRARLRSIRIILEMVVTQLLVERLPG